MSAAGAAAVAAQQQAALSSLGALVNIEAPGFLQILAKHPDPLVLVSRYGVFESWWRYLTSYKGICFVTNSPTELILPTAAEVVHVGTIHVPYTG